MWVVHAGNQIDSADRRQPRFPADNVACFEQRIRRFLGELRPSGVVSAAAAGADLIVLDVARSLGLRTEVVLPLEVDDFFERSVTGRGDTWGERFNRVVPTRSAAVVLDLSQHDDWYLRGNEVILQRAIGLAGSEGLLAVAVRPPADPAQPSATDDFVERATGHGLTVIDLDPRTCHLPTAFVVMPFGTKEDPTRSGVMIDCDATFQKLIVPLLEDADLDWVRADRSVESGFVHVGMLDQLANADVVIADLTLENPNVLYELGIRHALRPRTTLMVHRRGGVAMFDLRPLREFRFALDGTAITDDEALRAIGEIAPALAAARSGGTARIDSPLHTLFDVSPIPTIRARTGTADTDQFASLQRRLAALERDRRAGLLDQQLSAPALASLLREVESLRADGSSRRSLLFRLAVLLREAGRYQDALAVHGRSGLDERDEPADVSAVETLKERALCHRRLGEAALTAGADPEPHWAEATSLLDRALAARWSTADTHGVAGGLGKRRAEQALRRGDRLTAKVRFEQAARHYGRGTDLDPTDYYLLLNRTTTLRVLGQHFGETSSEDEARALLPIARYFAQRAYSLNPRDVYAAASLGELAYTEYRLGPDLVDAERAFSEVGRRYVEALERGPSEDQRRSMADQLAIYERLDGPDERLVGVRARIVDGRSFDA